MSYTIRFRYGFWTCDREFVAEMQRTGRIFVSGIPRSTRSIGRIVIRRTARRIGTPQAADSPTQEKWPSATRNLLHRRTWRSRHRACSTRPEMSPSSSGHKLLSVSSRDDFDTGTVGRQALTRFSRTSVAGRLSAVILIVRPPIGQTPSRLCPATPPHFRFDPSRGSSPLPASRWRS